MSTSTQTLSSCPALTIIGEEKYCTAKSSCATPFVAGLTDITSYSPFTVTLSPGETARVVAAPESPVNYLRIETPREIAVKLNGGAEEITVSRTLILLGEGITQVEIDNDKLTTPKQVKVQVTFAKGAGFS